MRIVLLTIVALAACSKGDWKERQGDGYVVTGPYSPKRQEQPAGDGVLTIFEYGNSMDQALQVQTIPLPADRDPGDAMGAARDQVLADADKVHFEKEVAVAGTSGKDFRFTWTDKEAGKLDARLRMFVRGGKLWMVTGHVQGGASMADADRFVESFRFTN